MRVNKRRIGQAPRQAHAPPVVLRRLRSALPSRRWYEDVFATDLSDAFGCGGSPCVAVRGLHLGRPDTTPESLLRMYRKDEDAPWRVLPHELLKSYAPFTLLSFAWVGDGFPADSRACLVGLAGGSLVHLWSQCVPGGETLRIDACELDGAVLELARSHLGLAQCESSGLVTCHEVDGAEFLHGCGMSTWPHAQPHHTDTRTHAHTHTRTHAHTHTRTHAHTPCRCVDAAYVLLMLDLDLGALTDGGGASAGCEDAAGAPSSGGGASDGDGGASDGDGDNDSGGAGSFMVADLLRVLTQDGVLVINEYSNEYSDGEGEGEGGSEGRDECEGEGGGSSGAPFDALSGARSPDAPCTLHPPVPEVRGRVDTVSRAASMLLAAGFPEVHAIRTTPHNVPRPEASNHAGPPWHL